MLILLICILSLSLLVFLILTVWDLVYAISLWISRIGIGRWEDRNEWKESVMNRTRKWLRHTPVAPSTDNRRFILLDILRGEYRSVSVQSWQVAGLLMGLGDEDSADYVKKHKKVFRNTPEVDEALLAYALKKNGALDRSSEERMLSLFGRYKDSGTIPYLSAFPNIRFVDTIGLACPFLYAIGLDSLAERQVEEYDRVLLDGVFPPHAFNLENGLPLGVFDWSRGMGWYILGLVESGRNEDRILKLAERMTGLQREDGSFGCFLFDLDSSKESSGTALAGILFVRAYRICGDKRFLDAARKAEGALMGMTRRNGVVDNAQGDTRGIGWYSSRFDRMPFAQGMTCYLSSLLEA